MGDFSHGKSSGSEETPAMQLSTSQALDLTLDSLVRPLTLGHFTRQRKWNLYRAASI